VIAEVIDYAYPCMMAEKALKELHQAMLNNDYDAALEHALTAMQWPEEVQDVPEAVCRGQGLQELHRAALH